MGRYTEAFTEATESMLDDARDSRDIDAALEDGTFLTDPRFTGEEEPELQAWENPEYWQSGDRTVIFDENAEPVQEVEGSPEYIATVDAIDDEYGHGAALEYVEATDEYNAALAEAEVLWNASGLGGGFNADIFTEFYDDHEGDHDALGDAYISWIEAHGVELDVADHGTDDERVYGYKPPAEVKLGHAYNPQTGEVDSATAQRSLAGDPSANLALQVASFHREEVAKAKGRAAPPRTI